MKVTSQTVAAIWLTAIATTVVAVAEGGAVAWWVAGFFLLGSVGGLLELSGVGRSITGRSDQRLAAVEENPHARLQRHIDEVNKAFAEAASVMSDLQRDLDAQQAAREVLLEQAGEQQRLLEVNEVQAEKIRQILVGETKATIRAERRQQWLFFALGALVSIPIGIAINLLVP
ncbi:hypothetical protein [Nonomuraea sp. NEAU-A123]|uniref:hypothetical protein n=1 Tax=Nonomuraea sp. NEAU-A123 TaxID=2839649 RepID=UPI001BE442D4|nr:hypothetical protein [Nonomuraea sp. NEAU-A123]MBT2232191.1 hypothetical protein [Nonomuraea sp. NEAU-A123]